jgi:adenosine deaminase
MAVKDEIVGLDLAGDEANFPAEWFTPHFKKARDAGGGSQSHAGESAGTESVWRAIQDLGASRIGHALCIMDDPALVDHMLRTALGLKPT